MMIDADLCLHCAWLVTVDDANRVLRDHSVVVDQGRIVAILPRAEAQQRYRPRESVYLERHILLPGLVNAHTHAAMSLLRGYADDLPLPTWLQQHIWPAEMRWVDEAFIEAGSALAMMEMLRGGTTCFNDMYFFPDVTARTAQQLHMRAVLGLIVLDFPTVWASDLGEYLAKGIALHDALRAEPLLTTAFAPHAPYTVSAPSLEKVATYSNEMDLPIHIHVHETVAEVEDFTRSEGVRPLQRLKELGLLNPSLLAVHMTQLLDYEIAQLAESGCHVLHCPESNMKLASGSCPVAKLRAAGCNVAIGTDGAASNNDLDMFGEMRSAALLAKLVSADAATFGANEALRAATINGARALGLEREIGSVEVGKAADLIAIDLDHPALQPLYDPISQIVYAAHGGHVSSVWVAGRARLREGQWVDLDAAKILADARQWGEKIGAGRFAVGR